MSRAVRAVVLLGAACLALSSCSPGGSDAVPRDAVTAHPKTCMSASASCASSGSVRWSLPLAGPYRLDADMGQWLRPVTLSTKGDNFKVAHVRHHVYLFASDTMTSLDAATGAKEWQRRLPGDSGDVIWAGNRLVFSASSQDAPTYYSFVPTTASSPLVRLNAPGNPLDTTEGTATARGSTFPLVFLSRPGSGRAGPTVVTGVDPTTGRQRWQRRLANGRSNDTAASTLYLDAPRRYTDAVARRAGAAARAKAKKAGARVLPSADSAVQTRALQRVDLRTGRHLPDLQLPRRVWGNISLSRVTDAGVAVLNDYDADQRNAQVAVDLQTSKVVPVPDVADGSKTLRNFVTREPSTRVKGAQRMMAYGADGHVRWRGPDLLGARALDRLDTSPPIALGAGCLPGAARQTTLSEPFDGTWCEAAVLQAVTW